MNQETKSFLTSKTLWGLVIAVVAQLLAKHGITVDADGLANDIASAAGVALSAYGRFQASQGLHVLPPKA